MERPKFLASAALILAILLAQVPFSLAEWISVGIAPDGSGIYNVVIEAAYNNITGTFPLELIVSNVSEYPTEGLEVEPVYPIGRIPPIQLKYDILLNGSRDFTMVSNKVSVYYAAGDTLLKSEEMALRMGEDGYWQVSVNVPLKGEYRAVISLSLRKGDVVYGGDFITNFESDTPSTDLVLSHRIDKRVLTPAEILNVGIEASFEEAVLPGLEIFNANLYSARKSLAWDSASHRYGAAFTAPNDEGVYRLNIYAEGQEFAVAEEVYVAEVAREKAARCPLANDLDCSDMPDVRKCVADYKNGIIAVTEDQLIECYNQATGWTPYTPWAIMCERDRKGDLDGDGHIDFQDLEMFQNMIIPLSQSERQDYVACADYDRDGDVDEQDLACLTRVYAGKWHGDLNGGICFDAAYESPFKCDLDGDGFIQEADALTLKDLIDAADAGIETPEEVLDACDFNQDGRLDSEDEECQDYFMGMDLDDPDTLLAIDTYIPESCLKIYNIDDCRDVRGDLNGDLTIDNVDLVLIMLIEKEQIAGYNLSCADVNEDGFVSVEDVMCVVSYIEGDEDFYFACIGCDEYTPHEYRYPIEICNDQYDNNCDGLIDRTGRRGEVDYCQCGPHTPCEYVWDEDGGTVPGVDDENVRTCRSVSWETDFGPAGEYFWMTPDTFQCSGELECESVECHNDTEWRCSFDGMEWDWRSSPDEVEELADPMEVPKLCEDGLDNDCVCGDQECDEPAKSGSMFGSWEFWVAAVIGAVLVIVTTILTAGTALAAWMPLIYALTSTALTVGSMYSDDPSLKAAVSGFSLGMAVGSVATSAYNIAQAGVQAAAGEAGGAMLGELAKGGAWAAQLPGLLGVTSTIGQALIAAGQLTLATANIALGFVSASKTPYDPTKLEWDRAEDQCA